MRVGSELKAARKKAGISVEVMSKRTKIAVGKLVALEKDDFKALPTGLYLFSTIRAYAREVSIDPEPIVERLRAEFADKDALDALHALDATGALDAKNVANPRRSSAERWSLPRNAAIAAGVVLVAAAGAVRAFPLLAGSAPSHEIRTAKVEPPSMQAPSPVSVTTVEAAVELPQQAAAPAPRTAIVKTPRPEKQTDAVSGSSDVMQQIEPPAPAQIEEPADAPANIEEFRSEAPVLATAP